jgi:hypothetical protein
MPEGSHPALVFITAYFASQSMGYGPHIKGLKEKAKTILKQ